MIRFTMFRTQHALLVLATIVTQYVLVHSATTHPAIQGSTANLVCDQQGANIFWERDGTTLSINTNLQAVANSNKFTVKFENDRYVLSIKQLALSDEAVYRCFDFGSSVIQEVTLVILVSPTPLQMNGPTLVVDEGAEMQYECSSSGGKPLPALTWTLMDFQNNVTDLTASSTNFDTLEADGTGTRRSVLRVTASRAMQRGTVACVASSPPLIYQESKSLVVDMNLRPLPPTITGNDESVNLGSRVEIKCHSNGAKPKPTIRWTRGSNVIEGVLTSVSEADGTFSVISTISLTTTREDDEAVYLCETWNKVMTDAGDAPHQVNTTLLLNYLPALQISQFTKTYREGNDVTINCTVDARPTVQNITWFQNGRQLDLGSRRYDVNDDVVSQSLTIKSLTRFDVGKFKCRGTNAIGTGTSQETSLDIYHRPACREDQQLRFGVPVGETARLQCSVYSNPNNASFHFKRNGQYYNYFGTRDPTDKYGSSATYSYLIRSQADYGTVECNVTNIFGATAQPCIFRIQAPAPAEAPQNCFAENVTSTTLNIRCTAGFDGGATQHFTLSQKEGNVFVLLQNRTSPEYEVQNLKPFGRYSFRICSSSIKFPDESACTGLQIQTANGPTEGVTPPQVGAIGTLKETDIYVLAGVGGGLLLIIIVATIAGCVYRNKTKKKSREIQKRGRNNFEIERRMEENDGTGIQLGLEMAEIGINLEEGDVTLKTESPENVRDVEKSSTSDDGYSSVGQSKSGSQSGAYVMAVEINDEVEQQAQRKSSEAEISDASTLEKSRSDAKEAIVLENQDDEKTAKETQEVIKSLDEAVETCVNPVYNSSPSSHDCGEDNLAFDKDDQVQDSSLIIENADDPTEKNAPMETPKVKEDSDSSSSSSSEDEDEKHEEKGKSANESDDETGISRRLGEDLVRCSTNRASEVDIESVQVKITESQNEDIPEESNVTIEIRDVPKSDGTGAFF